MIIKSAEFLTSNATIDSLPDSIYPEYAFIGRSNVGKSSLINMLTGKKGLAKTSQTPGKTQLVNHFKINNSWYLCDLPGYGFAKASKTSRSKWNITTLDYLRNRTNLQYVFQLIDSRLPPQKIDLEFITWLGENNVPFVLVFTKADKLSKRQTILNTELFKSELLKQWELLPPVFVSSAEKFDGRDEILEFIEQSNLIFADAHE